MSTIECKGFLEKVFTSKGIKIDVKLIHDNGTTGNFEIKAGDTLVHSKKTKGQGFVDSQAKLDAVVNGILAVVKK